MKEKYQISSHNISPHKFLMWIRFAARRLKWPPARTLLIGWIFLSMAERKTGRGDNPPNASSTQAATLKPQTPPFLGNISSLVWIGEYFNSRRIGFLGLKIHAMLPNVETFDLLENFSRFLYIMSSSKNSRIYNILQNTEKVIIGKNSLHKQPICGEKGEK